MREIWADTVAGVSEETFWGWSSGVASWTRLLISSPYVIDYVSMPDEVG